ncbi:membrane-anchored junction protein [Pempheris klunzingeri]|uniref:membrane-anchored junction protein n=1 Tax=Pempheris klunzingeri TaxID=3127111 RepID=UPI00397FE759
MEEIIRAVLGNLDSLQPFCTTHFIVFPYKKRWDGVSKAMCKLGEKTLRAYPFIVILYLEANMQNGRRAEEKLSPVSCRSVNHKEKDVAQKCSSVPEPQSKRRKRDSPLEDAIIKDLIKDLEAESKVSRVRLRVDCLHPEGEAKVDPGHVDKKGTERCDKSGVSTVRGGLTPAEVHPRINQDMGQEGGVEGGGDAASGPGTPERPGALARLASHIFSFSLFFRDT